MKICRVERPFYYIDRKKMYQVGDTDNFTEEAVERLLKINPNMVAVLGEATEQDAEKPKPKRCRAKSKE